MFEPINLDGLSTDASDYDLVSHVFSIYSVYADSKAHAIRYRLNGDVEAAVSFEKAGAAAYKRLPMWAKW